MMMSKFGGEWFVEVRRSGLFPGVEIDFWCMQGREYFHVEPMEMSLKKYDSDEMLKGHSLSIDFRTQDAFLKSLAEALNKFDVKPENDAKLEGELKATKYHLEDLRMLLKVKEK